MKMTLKTLTEKLDVEPKAGKKPWMAGFGKLSRFRKETKRINAIIEAEFEQIEPEERAERLK